MLKNQRFAAWAAGMMTVLGWAGAGRCQAPAEKADAAPPAPNAVLTESVGLFAGVQLYQTYLNIGLLADARAAGVYEDADAGHVLGSVLEPLKKVDKQLEKLAALKGLDKEDAAAVARLRKIAALLILQGDSLAAFWTTDQQAPADKYEAARLKAWAELEDFLDMKPKTVLQTGPPPREVPAKK